MLRLSERLIRHHDEFGVVNMLATSKVVASRHVSCARRAMDAGRPTDAKAKSSQNLPLHFNCTRLLSQKDKELASCLASS